MNIEQLQGMTDDELNELSATKVMGWEPVQRDGYVSYYNADGTFIKDYAWNPTNDMNDAMELVNAFGNALALQGPGSTDMNENYRDFKTWTADLAFKCNTEATADTAPRAITIASILAKEE